MNVPNKETLKSALANLEPDDAAAVIEALLKKQAADFNKLAIKGRNVNMPYYNSKTAEEIRPAIDDMVRTGQNLEVLYADYPTMSPHTVRCKLEGGIRYLVDNDTDNGPYVQWRSRVEVRKHPAGCSVVWIVDPKRLDYISMDGTLKPRLVPTDEMPTSDISADDGELKKKVPYMGEVSSFINNAKEGDHKKIVGLKLTHQEIKNLYQLFEPVTDLFELKVTPDRILLYRGKLTQPSENNEQQN